MNVMYIFENMKAKITIHLLKEIWYTDFFFSSELIEVDYFYGQYRK